MQKIPKKIVTRATTRAAKKITKKVSPREAPASPLGLQPADEKLYRAFQSNLLSLISHELRTPLVGIINAVNLLDDLWTDAAAALAPGALVSTRTTTQDMLAMAKRNAERLHAMLTNLLDLAAVETGAFNVRLREVDLLKCVNQALVSREHALTNAQVSVDRKERGEQSEFLSVLGDPRRVVRVLELCLDILAARAVERSRAQVRSDASGVSMEFALRPGAEKLWDSAWAETERALKGSTLGAFAGVIGSETDFLSRTEEGLGSEFLLIQEIMRLHQGRFLAQRSRAKDGKPSVARLELRFADLSSEEWLTAILASRAHAISTELSSVALVLLPVPARMDTKVFGNRVRSQLFRATDAVYPLPKKQRVALVLDDCKPEDIMGLVGRLTQSLPELLGGKRVGTAHCPSDTFDPLDLIKIAEQRLFPSKN